MVEQTSKITHDLDQKRAARAWEMVLNCGNDYTNLAKSAPALIMNNGLMQTLAFYWEKGKKKDHYKALCSHICEWLAIQVFQPSKTSFEAIMKELYSSSSSRYRYATQEALAFLRWIRQFAAALQTKD
jgi:CRISPR-associated protein Cmr5